MLPDQLARLVRAKPVLEPRHAAMLRLRPRFRESGADGTRHGSSWSNEVRAEAVHLAADAPLVVVAGVLVEGRHGGVVSSGLRTKSTSGALCFWTCRER